MRRAIFLARRTCRGGRSRWASARFCRRGKLVMLAFGEHKARIIRPGGRGRSHARRSRPAFCSSIRTRLSCWTRRPSAELTRSQDAVAAAVGGVGRGTGADGGDLAGPQARKADPQAHGSRITTRSGLQDLLADRGPAYNINVEVFRDLQATITGWPGGKPAHRSSRATARNCTTTFSRSGCSFFRRIRTTT